MNVPDSLMTTILKGWEFLYKRGFIEGFGHISARFPDNPDLFLLARHSLGPRAVPEDFLIVDMEGRMLGGKGDMPGEYPIHLDILRARPDVGSVIHYHGMYSTAFTTSQQTLKPIHLMGTIFHDGIPTYPDPRLVSTRERDLRWPRRSARIARCCSRRMARRLPGPRSKRRSAAPFSSKKTHIAPASAPRWVNRSGSRIRWPPPLALNC